MNRNEKKRMTDGTMPLAGKPLIVVLGMHRSGTSAVTRALKVLSVDLGDSLIGPIAGDNEKGFWEDVALNAFNDALLAKLDSGWHRMGPLDASLLAGNALRSEQRAAIALLDEKMAGRGIFGFKDPRTAVLLPFWREVFTAAGVDDRYVIVLRNPLEVAKSLRKRNGFHQMKSLLLWAKHLVAAIHGSRGRKRMVVAYDAMLTDPEAELSRMARCLDLPAPDADPEALAAYTRQFLDPGLRRNVAAVERLEDPLAVPPLVAEIHRLLAEAAAEASHLEDPSFQGNLADIERRFGELQPLLTYMDTLDTALHQARRDAESAAKDLSAAREAEARAQGRCEAEQAERLRLADAFQQLQVRSADASSQLQAQLADATRQLQDRQVAAETALRQARDAQERRAAADRERIAAMETALDNERRCRKALVSAHENRITALQQRLQDAEEAHARIAEALKARASALAAERDTLRQESAAAEKRSGEALAALRGQLEQARREASDRENALALARAELEVMRRSNSWRLTGALRSLRRQCITRPNRFLRRVGSDTSRWIWHHLPVSPERKLRFKDRVFTWFPTFFGWTLAYRVWTDMQQGAGAPAHQPALRGDSAPKRASASRHASGEGAGPDYVPPSDAPPPARLPVRAIAFYLPQFHAIPENDAWWGEGFTEWTNVRPAKPQFEGHYQPHVPGELGYYSLLDPAVQRRQVALARQYGISGFCFYFYWFGGRRLLEAPIRNYRNDPRLDLPFCLCWANENWSRRWDGRDEDVLMAQAHSPEDDLAFIAHVAGYMRDPRYIRIGGRPLLLVYRPSLLPSPKKTAQRWRKWCLENGIGDIYLAYTQSFESVDPARYGFDAAVEFPPNNSGPPDVTDQVVPRHDGFGCTVYDWRVFVARSERYGRPGYKIFRSVCPGWDNTARRGSHDTVFVNNTPDGYRKWLENAIQDTLMRTPEVDERLLFINAWNEWAEGAHLEPDQKYGYAWLNATRLAMAGFGGRREKMIVVTHDLHQHGAQLLALHLAREFKGRLGYDVATLALGKGTLRQAFEAVGPVIGLDRSQTTDEAILSEVRKLAGQGYRYAIVNSSASGWIVPHLADAGIRCVTLIHELTNIIRRMGLEKNIQAIDTYSEKVIFPSPVVMEQTAIFCRNGGWTHAEILPQGVYKRDGITDFSEKQAAKTLLSKRMGFPPATRLVLGVGFGDHRKGVDIFVESAVTTASRRPDVHFIWLGEFDAEMKSTCMDMTARAANIRANIHFPGFVQDTKPFYAAADIYALTSREDPFPSTALEALSAGTPVVMTAGTGGIEALGDTGAVHVIRSGRPEAFSSAFLSLLDHPEELRHSGRLGREIIGSRFGFSSYAIDLVNAFGEQIPRISVVVPNYNYSRYLETRLGSVLNQTLPPWEVIFLDDASTDDSVAVAKKILTSSGVRYRIVCNPETSGNVFGQWKKGVEIARGDYVWIAEADDFADHGFLEAAMKGFEREEIVLSYTQSKQIDGQGNIICPHYLDYVKDVSDVKWRNSYANEGTREIVEGLSVKNTIPNVSAVVFRRRPLEDVLGRLMDEIRSYRVAGDWFVYVNILKKGDIHYDDRPFNHHRRHNDSVTLQRFGLAELNEIARMQHFIAREFDLPEELKIKARDYLDALIRQFSLRNHHSEIDIQNAIVIAN